MRNISKLVLSLLVMLALTPSVQALGEQANAETLEQFMAMLKQDLKDRRNAALRGILKFDEAQQAVAFAPLQNGYDEESAQIALQRQELLQEFGKVHANLPPTTAHKMAEQFFTQEELRIGLRRKYYRLMSDKVSTVTAVQFLQIQNQFETLADVQLASRVPIAGGGEAGSEAVDQYLETMKKNLTASRDKALKEIIRLDGDEAKRFEATKKAYDRAFDAQSKVRRELFTEYGKVYKDLTPETADDLASRVFALHEARIELHRKYLRLFSEAVSSEVAVQFLQIQNRFETMADVKAATYAPVAGM